MGTGASSLHRIRQSLLIKAYNACRTETSIAEQFYEDVTFNETGEPVLSKQSIAKVLQMDSMLALETILQRCGFTLATDYDFILYDDFIDFLEKGTVPSSRPRRRKERAKHIVKIPKVNCHSNVYKEVWDLLGFRYVSSCRAIIPSSSSSDQNYHKQTDKKSLNNTSNVWKKHETVIQERIVKFVTRNIDGSLEELEEREKKQDEVIHMECKDSEQFAHHELSQYEKTEAFNDEVVSCRRGIEELLHLKSLDDEYEYFDSSMPEKENVDASASDINCSFD